jgi:hypothetical protein
LILPSAISKDSDNRQIKWLDGVVGKVASEYEADSKAA